MTTTGIRCAGCRADLDLTDVVGRIAHELEACDRCGTEHPPCVPCDAKPTREDRT